MCAPLVLGLLVSVTSIPNNIRIAPRSLGFLTDFAWWKAMLACARQFAPRCVLPAVTLTAANLILIFSNWAINMKLQSMKDVTNINITDFVIAGVVALVGLILGLGLSLFSLSIWLVRLTSFAHAFLANRSSEISNEEFNASTEYVKARKTFIARFWLLASAYVLLPILTFSVLVALRMMTGPQWSVNGEQLVPLPHWLTPTTINFLVNYLGPAILLATLAYCMVAIVFSALAQGSPWRAANIAFAECFKHPLVVFVVTVVVAILNMVITSPIACVSLAMPGAGLETNIWAQAASYVWLGVTSAIIWPASVAPFCMIIADEHQG